MDVEVEISESRNLRLKRAIVISTSPSGIDDWHLGSDGSHTLTRGNAE